jgi:superfamily II DNA helicase RecQ
VICTNVQLAQVVRSRPRSLNKLGEIEGFGSAKLRKYGSEILAHLGSGDAPPEERKDG